jgi:hypothetical protein
MVQNKPEEVAKSTIDEGVIQPSLEIPEKSAAPDNATPDLTGDVPEGKFAPVEDDAISTLSTRETKVNFGFLPIPARCRITPTRPFKFNLAINILFGFASTFTVYSTPRNILTLGRESIL